MIHRDMGPIIGDAVRAKCGATGRYVGEGLVLIVSAQDNGLFVDALVVGEPWEKSPLPTRGECEAFNVGRRHAKQAATI